jgi:hypothetical protein
MTLWQPSSKRSARQLYGSDASHAADEVRWWRTRRGIGATRRWRHIERRTERILRRTK